MKITLALVFWFAFYCGYKVGRSYQDFIDNGH